MRLNALILSALLSGCGTTATQEWPENTSFTMVSIGEASFIYKAFMGGVDYCKVTRHDSLTNDEGYDYDITYSDGECEVRAFKRDKQ